MRSNKSPCLHRLIIIAWLLSFPVIADELDDLSAHSKDLITSLTSKLNTQYENAYALNKPDAVADICRKQSGKLTTDLSRDGWTIRRISLAYLNEANMPDAIEKKIMQDFAGKYANGWKTDQLAWYKLTEAGNQSEFRYVKATAYEDRCMSCHNSQRGETGSQPGLYAFALKKIETKNYIEEPVQENETHEPLPTYGE